MFVIYSIDYDYDLVIWCKDVNFFNVVKEGNWSILIK